MLYVAGMVTDPAAIREVRAALGRNASAEFVTEHDDLLRLASRTRLDAVVVEVGSGQVRMLAAVVSALRKSFPALPIIAYCRPGPHASEEITRIVRAGADELALRGIDDLGLTIRRALGRSPAGHHSQRVLQRIAAAAPPDVLPVVTYCLDHICEPLSVDALARAHQVHRKTLVNRFARAGWPPPGVVSRWCRLLVAASLLQDPARTVAQTAPLVGCPSPMALRALLRRLAHAAPRTLRRRGFDSALALFRLALERPRRDRREVSDASDGRPACR
jgi:AraC-like DNA-binding protein